MVLVLERKMELAKSDRLKTLLDVPWVNIVHSYGRASDFPEQVKTVLQGDQSVYLTIANNMEHQGTIWPATPFMLRVLLELLNHQEANREKILNICIRVYDACLDFLSHDGSLQTIPNINAILETIHLWEDYIDEEQDGILWEDYDYSAEDWYSCCCICMELFDDYKSGIKELVDSADISVKESALRLYRKIDEN